MSNWEIPLTPSSSTLYLAWLPPAVVDPPKRKLIRCSEGIQSWPMQRSASLVLASSFTRHDALTELPNLQRSPQPRIECSLHPPETGTGSHLHRLAPHVAREPTRHPPRRLRRGLAGPSDLRVGRLGPLDLWVGWVRRPGSRWGDEVKIKEDTWRPVGPPAEEVWL